MGISSLRGTYLAEDLVSEQINKELNQLMYMVDRNQIGCQNGRRFCERLMGRRRGRKIVRSIPIQRVVRQMNSDVAGAM